MGYLPFGKKSIALPIPGKAETKSISSLRLGFIASLGICSTAVLAQTEATSLEEIVVTGSRATIQSSINIKRDSDEIVDGLSAVDIGDLPALSIGEALESIAGAASHRENGGATEISIRGLGPFLSSTVFNGREATNGSGDRSVNFSQFPAELMSKVAIYKTQDASLIEGGVAGQIQLETLKPLDYDERRIQFDVKGNYNPDQQDVSGSMSGDLGHRATVSYVDQFEFNDGGRFGLALGYQDSDISQPEQEARSSSPTGTSLRPCLADPDNRELDPSDANDFGRGFAANDPDGVLADLPHDDDCEDWMGGNDSVNYTGDNSSGYDTRVGADDLASDFVLVPNERGYRQNDTSDTREAFFASFQFQPNEQWDINLDVQWSERVQEEDRHDMAAVQMRRNTNGLELDALSAEVAALVGGPFASGLPTSSYDSLTISPTGATSTFATETIWEARGETYNRTEEYLGGGLSVAWNVNEDLTLSADVSTSETTRTETQWLIRTQSDQNPNTYWTNQQSDVGNFIIGESFDVTDHSNFIDRYRARIDNDVDRTNTSNAIRFDLNQDLHGGVITGIDAGVRMSSLEYVNLGDSRTEFEIRNDRDQNGDDDGDFDDGSPEQLAVIAEIEANNALIAAANEACALEFQEGNNFLSSERSGDLFTTVDDDGNLVASGNSFASFDTECLVNAVADYLGESTATPDLVASGETTDVTEDVLAGYVQARYSTEIADIPVRGKFGVRVVKTDVESIGIRTELLLNDSDPSNLFLENGDPNGRLVSDTSYTEVLPSFSFVADIADDKILRGGIFKGMSRADPADMGFFRTFSTVTDEDSGVTDVNDLISSVNASGNPAYEPLTSWNYDLSFEWYPNDDSILSAGVYYKDFTGGFENVVEDEVYSVDGVDITVPVTLNQTNDDTSTLYGFEVTASTRFSNLPAPFDGLGAKVSYNWADSDFEFEDSNLGVRGFTDENGNFVQTNVGIIAPSNLPGFSEETFSGQLYYQIGEFDASLIYKYRSEYFQPYTSNGTRIRYVDDVGVWEARASYYLTDNVRLSVEAINLFGAPKQTYYYVDDHTGESNVYGPRVFVGLRAKF